MSHTQALPKWLRASGSCSYAHSGLRTTLASLGRQKQKLGLGSKLCPLSHSSGEKTGVTLLFKCPGPFFPVPHAIFISKTPPSVFNPIATKASTTKARLSCDRIASAKHIFCAKRNLRNPGAIIASDSQMSIYPQHSHPHVLLVETK